MNNHYDLITIGGGSGGLAVAETAAQHGKKVAIIETYKMGGTCVNKGCVPKKVIWYAANLAHAVDDAKHFGIPARRGNTDWQKLILARENYIRNITSYWDNYVSDNGIHHIQGHASFIDNKTLQVNNKTYTAEHVVIATGGQPVTPDLPGAELGISSDGFFKLQQQAENIAIIGGGYIGVELSCVLQALGSNVTLFALENQLMHQFDSMPGQALMNEMQTQGIHLHLNFEVSTLEKTAEPRQATIGENKAS